MRGYTPLILASALLAFSPVALPVPAAGQTQSSSAQAKTGSKPQADNSNVLILETPKMPAQAQFTPELRAVDLESRKRLGETTQMRLIQLMDAEFAHARKYIPLGDKSLTIDPRGRVTPDDATLFQETQARGTAASVGDKVEITNVVFHEKSIYFELNGGPKKKTHWYQHISVGVGGAGGGVTPVNGEQSTPTGAAFTLKFRKPVPEMRPEDIKKLLSPVLDFSSKTPAQVYAETLPPKIRDAIQKHEVLVGMNQEMVIAAKDRPQQKVREKDDKGKEYEDWIYGKPPQEVVFVRMVGDEVTMVKIAKAGQPIIVKTQKEVAVKDGVASLAALQAGAPPQEASNQPAAPQQPAYRPTLRRPDEPAQPSLQLPAGGQEQPDHPSEPEWGTGGKPSGQPPAPSNPSPPPELF